MAQTEEIKTIDIDSPAWAELINKIVTGFDVGELIPHKFLKKEMGIEYIRFKDYESQEDFEKALEIRQFTYMGLIDKLRNDLLDKEKFYLKNIKGDGYIILPPAEQVDFAFGKAVSDIKKTLKTSEYIMANVRKKMVNPNKRKHDADTMAKFSMYRQMIVGMLNKRK